MLFDSLLLPVNKLMVLRCPEHFAYAKGGSVVVGGQRRGSGAGQYPFRHFVKIQRYGPSGFATNPVGPIGVAPLSSMG
jgi:hypothetical protein